ncbi:MAG: phosphatase PAP2 family protein [Gemmatimonadota bacterium]|nr:phosphatase PAP2 family protein [Gemmatimonadota bacterium]
MTLAAASVLAASTATAQAPTAPPPTFTAGDGWMAGGFVAATLLAMPFDERLARWMQQPAQQNDAAMKNTATVFRNLADPGTVVIGGGLYIAGRLTHDRTMTDVGLHSSEAIVAASVAGFVIKSAAGRARPRVDIANPHDYKFGRGLNSNDYESFPSGHALAAFALASAVTAEAGYHWADKQTLIGALTYGGATLSALSRPYNNAHWLSDVVLGAGIGTLAGRLVVRWQHTHPDNWVDRTFLGMSVAPAPGGGVAVAFHATR